jgi:hypothetical protein
MPRLETVAKAMHEQIAMAAAMYRDDFDMMGFLRRGVVRGMRGLACTLRLGRADPPYCARVSTAMLDAWRRPRMLRRRLCCSVCAA